MKAIYKKTMYQDDTILSVMKVTKYGTVRIGFSGDISVYVTDVTNENDLKSTEKEFNTFKQRALIVHNNAISKLLEL